MWEVTIFEAESAEQIYRGLVALTREMPGFFKTYKVAPALQTEDAIRIILE